MQAAEVHRGFILRGTGDIIRVVMRPMPWTVRLGRSTPHSSTVSAILATIAVVPRRLPSAQRQRCTTTLQCRHLSGKPLPWLWSKDDRLSGTACQLAFRMKQQGYIAVELSKAEDKVLRQALLHFEAAKTFRYPPRDEEEPGEGMPEEYRRAFNLLYSIAARAAQKLRAVATEEGWPGFLHDNLPDEPCREGLFPFDGMEEDVPFSASFFNIFNYDHGCLNVHSDVGIVTAVYGVDALCQESCKPLENTSRL
eukprot:5668414-Amphidinium_carterae.1